MIDNFKSSNVSRLLQDQGITKTGQYYTMIGML